MTVQFTELPAGQASPTVTQASQLTGYCTASDVASLNKAREIGQGKNPTLTDINGYIEMVAGEINAVLIAKGYQTPVDIATYPEAEGILGWVNATGAWKMMEQASPNSPNIDRAAAAFDSALKMIADAQFVLNAPQDQNRAGPRGPGLTSFPTGEIYDPFEHARCDRRRATRPFFSRETRY